jgi:hypothetical protein
MIVQVPNVLVTLMTYHGTTKKATNVDRAPEKGEWGRWSEEKRSHVSTGKPEGTRLRGRSRCQWRVH